MATYLITGANRGIGLEFARQLAARGETVIATARKPSDADDLTGLPAEIVTLDVTDDKSVAKLAGALEGRTVDVLISNAGMNPSGRDGFESFESDEMTRCLRINAVGPLAVARAALPALDRGARKLVVNISSQMGSIANAKADGAKGSYAYRSSKAALNMVTTLMAADLKDRGVTCVAMHPGWVRTDMGGPNATLSPEESVSSMLSVIDRLTPRDTGAFIDPAGKPLPW